jgi:ubiquinone/menaquinone biosynthesis C-methylase UbiE
MTVRTLVTSGVNRAFRPLGMQVVRGWSDDPAIQPFLSARRTLAAAKRKGLSLCEYIDQYSAEPGTTATIVQSMLSLADLGDHVDRVCEIGPGTGRFAEPVMAALHPEVYEAYETAADWRAHLRGVPGITLLPADGHSLKPTATNSVDLVHAHRVFVYLPLVVTIGYLQEMARVVKEGGAIAFDIVTESCLDAAATDRWVTENAIIYNMIPRQWVIDLLDRYGLSLVGTSFAPMSGAKSEYFVFRKRTR